MMKYILEVTKKTNNLDKIRKGKKKTEENM